jgi:nucleoid-associated protein YgaU
LGKYWRLIGEYDGEAVAYAPVLGTTSGAGSPFTPTENARLIALRTTASQITAATVTTCIQWRLTSATFKPNSIEVGFQGNGLQTAPSLMGVPQDWVVDQPVTAGVPVTVEARVAGAMANVTNEIYLWGLFQS